MPFAFDCIVHCKYENRICPVFEWLRLGLFQNGQVFECHLKVRHKKCSVLECFWFFNGRYWDPNCILFSLQVDAWETKYGECRGAAIDRLERLCQDKVHLKVPASASNLKTKKKAQIVDVSILKAPTGSGSTPENLLDTEVEVTSSKCETPTKSATVKVSKIGVTAKPHNVKPSSLIGNANFCLGDYFMVGS